jgi:hypothetical protein
MVCRLEDIYCNWEFPLHISHDDFDTDKWSVDFRLVPLSRGLTGTHANDTLTPPF